MNSSKLIFALMLIIGGTSLNAFGSKKHGINVLTKFQGNATYIIDGEEYEAETNFSIFYSQNEESSFYRHISTVDSSFIVFSQYRITHEHDNKTIDILSYDPRENKSIGNGSCIRNACLSNFQNDKNFSTGLMVIDTDDLDMTVAGHGEKIRYAANLKFVGYAISGIGVLAGKNINDKLVIKDIRPNTPADRLELPKESFICEISKFNNDEFTDTSILSLEEAVSMIRGPVSTEIALKLAYVTSSCEKSELFVLKREEITTYDIQKKQLSNLENSNEA